MSEVSKTPEELYQERAKRVDDAVNLRIPDRVPIVPDAEFFPQSIKSSNRAREITQRPVRQRLPQQGIMLKEGDHHIQPPT